MFYNNKMTNIYIKTIDIICFYKSIHKKNAQNIDLVLFTINKNLIYKNKAILILDSHY